MKSYVMTARSYFHIEQLPKTKRDVRATQIQFGRSSEKLDAAITQLELALEDSEEGRGAGRPGRGGRNSGPAAAPPRCAHHPRRQLPAAREAPLRADQSDTRTGTRRETTVAEVDGF